MERSNRCQLMEGIVALSEGRTWYEAKLEWDLCDIFHQDEPDTCLCGHFPILELCVLLNRKNGKEVIVGNVCVKKFLGLPSDLVFQAVRRVSKDVTKALNAEAIAHAHMRGWINAWERDFCFNTMRKRVLSDKQASKRIQINRKVMDQVNKNRSVANTASHGTLA